MKKFHLRVRILLVAHKFQDRSRRLRIAFTAARHYCSVHFHKISGFNVKLCIKHNLYMLCNETKLVLCFSHTLS